MTPILTQAVVIGQDPKTGGLNVAFPSGQMAAYPVKFGFHGPADGIRVNHPAMPGRGTWGLVAFPGGDDRYGVWISSIYAAMDDARTTNTDAFLEYNSHQSGFYETLDKIGQKVIAFPDGTSLVVGSGTTKPATYRHVVDDKQFPQLQVFPDAERVPSPPAPFNVTFTHPNGVTININPAGLVTVSSGSGAAILTMDAAGQIDLRGTGVEIGGLSETLYRLIDERFVALYNSHVHPTPSGTSDPPTVPMVVGAQTTTITFAG